MIHEAQGSERRFVFGVARFVFPGLSINFHINAEHDYPHPVICLYPTIHVSFKMSVNAFAQRKDIVSSAKKKKKILFKIFCWITNNRNVNGRVKLFTFLTDHNDVWKIPKHKIVMRYTCLCSTKISQAN